MSVIDDVKALLAQYASGGTPTGDVGAHFQQTAQSVDSGTVAQGIAAALRSDQTPPFGQMVSQLFSSGSSDQKTAMVNTLLGAADPGQRTQLASLIPGLAGASSVTKEQVAAISPSAVQSLAEQVERRDGGIVDKMSSLYAAHPMLVKTLGTTALMIAMRRMAQRHQ